MKARIKKTGEIVNLAEYARITLDSYDYLAPIVVKPEEVEFIQEPTEDNHWQDVRERAAIAAMQGLINAFSLSAKEEQIALCAVKQADALIEDSQSHRE